MAVPKRKTSKRRTRMRKASHKRQLVATAICQSCSATHLPHRICPSCGSYRGRQLLTITAED